MKKLALVVNRKDGTRGVSIMRPSLFGNPFKIGRDGSREQVIAKFKLYLWNRVRVDRKFYHALEDLRGQTLVCCCKPLACHGDVILAYLDWISETAFNPFLAKDEKEYPDVKCDNCGDSLSMRGRRIYSVCNSTLVLCNTCNHGKGEVINDLPCE